MGFLCATVLVSLFSGSYPAFFLSSMPALNRKFSSHGKSKGIRSGLVVFQFVISIILVFAILVIDRQMEYISNKNIGYDREEILVLRNSYRLGNANTVIRQELLKSPKVIGVSQSSFIPAGPTDNAVYGIYKDGSFKRRSWSYTIDENYLDVMGINLLEGRNFSSDLGSKKGMPLSIKVRQRPSILGKIR